MLKTGRDSVCGKWRNEEAPRRPEVIYTCSQGLWGLVLCLDSTPYSIPRRCLPCSCKHSQLPKLVFNHLLFGAKKLVVSLPYEQSAPMDTPSPRLFARGLGLLPRQTIIGKNKRKHLAEKNNPCPRPSFLLSLPTLSSLSSHPSALTCTPMPFQLISELAVRSASRESFAFPTKLPSARHRIVKASAISTLFVQNSVLAH